MGQNRFHARSNGITGHISKQVGTGEQDPRELPSLRELGAGALDVLVQARVREEDARERHAVFQTHFCFVLQPAHS